MHTYYMDYFDTDANEWVCECTVLAKNKKEAEKKAESSFDNGTKWRVRRAD